MDATVVTPVNPTLDRYMRAHGQSGRTGPDLLNMLLPPKNDQDYLWVLAELVRADMEQSRQLGLAYSFAEYQAYFPELPMDSRLADVVSALEAESVRQLKAGSIHPKEDATRAVEVLPFQQDLHDPSVDTPAPSVHTKTKITGKTKLSITRYPSINEIFLGFRLVGDLGSGAFARVFLAEQIELSNRLVALKVTTRPTREPQRLAKLRHTNIVPIYSVHDDAKPFQAVCMPFLGRQTLADLLKAYRATGVFPHTSNTHQSTAAVNKLSTLKSKSKSKSDAGTDSKSNILIAPIEPEQIAWPIRENLSGKSHVELVLWLLNRMTEGLAHAHSMGILHLDIKPANVLFADDGEPLLLDFNLAFDRGMHDRQHAGGTLPYMAPEQLEEYRDQQKGVAKVDERTDLFALGVMCFELLTGQLPFAIPNEKPVNISKLIDKRKEGAPEIRGLNPEINFAVASIVHKLLAPEPQDRYQTAAELLEDLRRQHENYPLKYAANSSVKERLQKWHKRNTNVVMLACLSVAILTTIGLTFSAYRREAESSRIQAAVLNRTLEDDLKHKPAELLSRDDSRIRSRAIKDAKAVLTQIGFPTQGTFPEHRLYLSLSPSDKAHHRKLVGQLCLYLAHAEWLNAVSTSAEEQHFQEALLWNLSASSCLTVDGKTPLVVTRQREFLKAQQGKAVYTYPETIPDPEYASADLLLRGSELMSQGLYLSAAPVLEQLVKLSPNQYVGYLNLAICQQQAGLYSLAMVNYRVSQALGENDPRPSHNKGVLFMTRKEFVKAEEAFSDSIQFDSINPYTWMNRAKARQALGKYELALKDINKADELGLSQILVLLHRARIFNLLKQPGEAAKALEALKSVEPSTAEDFSALGFAKIRTEPKEALKCLTKACDLNPKDYIVWQNLAALHSDYAEKKDQKKALEAQNQAVALAPEFAPAWAGRAVIHARIGLRQEAHKDVEQALFLSNDSSVLYRACCAFALTAKTNANDRERALKLFVMSLKAGYRNFKEIEADDDVISIRDSEEFKAALNAARILEN
jgi:eukaryotic-like serine/threonine-protein kinase